jgi:hypothetical protein
MNITIFDRQLRSIVLKNCGSANSNCGLELANYRKIVIAELQLRINSSLKSCGIAIAEVHPSSCAIAIADLKKSCVCPPLEKMYFLSFEMTRGNITTFGFFQPE